MTVEDWPKYKGKKLIPVANTEKYIGIGKNWVGQYWAEPAYKNRAPIFVEVGSTNGYGPEVYFGLSTDEAKELITLLEFYVACIEGRIPEP